MTQVLSAGRTCREALANVLAHLAALDGRVASASTSAYCQARARLDPAWLGEIHGSLLRSVETRLDGRGLWYRRNAVIVDGSAVSMPDSASNQTAFPQPRTQKPGCGFPVARIAVIFSLAAGAMLDLAWDSLHVAETTLFRRMWPGLRAGDVVLGDRGFSGLAEIGLRDAKITRGMDVLRCKSPEMAERELRVIVIAHNLVRATMLEAARTSGNSTSRVSFMGTIARIRQWAPILAAAIDGETVARLYGDMLRSLAEDRVPDRPNRLEPRATKRRPKNYQRLTKPRGDFRESPHRSKSTRPLT